MPGSEIAIADELRRLGGCADIPAHRRRALLRLADSLAPYIRDQHAEVDVFADPYYRRAGLRLRRPREEMTYDIPKLALLSAPAQDESDAHR